MKTNSNPLLLLSSISILLALLFTFALNIICFSNPYLFSLYCIYVAYAIFIDQTPFNGGRDKTNPIWKSMAYWTDYFSLLHLCAEYFPCKLIKATNHDFEKGPYLFACHPRLHLVNPDGVVGLSHHVNFLSSFSDFNNLFPALTNLKLCTLNLNFYVPFARDVLLTRGFISADKVLVSLTCRGRSRQFLTEETASLWLWVAPKNRCTLSRAKTFSP